jgi:membrane associated rhomboid family serine protease
MQEFRPSSSQNLPNTVKHLIIINVLLFITTLAFSTFQHVDISKHLALHSLESTLFRPWQILTHMFMHGDVGKGPEYLQVSMMHIIMNMLGLWMFGSVLENRWGSKRFLIFYFMCGLGAAAAHLSILQYENNVIATAVDYFNSNPTWAQFNSFVKQNIGDAGHLSEYLEAWKLDANNPAYSENAIRMVNDYKVAELNNGTVGASGAVFGILAAFAYYFPNTLLYIYFFFPIKAKWAIIAYACYELYSGVRHSAGDNVAHFAHLGGALIGILIVLFWNKTNRKTLY